MFVIITVDIYCIMLQMRLLLLLTLFPILSLAKGDECINEHTPDLRRFCMAKQYANGTECDKIRNLDIKGQCVSIVRNKQREVMWAIKPMDVASIDTRGDKKYIWER